MRINLVEHKLSDAPLNVRIWIASFLVVDSTCALTTMEFPQSIASGPSLPSVVMYGSAASLTSKEY
jgi:hypothetical protein